MGQGRSEISGVDKTGGSMNLSRIMKNEDYKELEEEGKIILEIQSAIQMWYPQQHQHRLWEYAMAQKALKLWFGERKHLTVSDHGCGAGYLSPILYWLGNHVLMYECWSMGDQEQYAMEQMRKVGWFRGNFGGSYELRTRPLGELTVSDKGVDAAFCISTLEHIKDYRKAFVDLLGTVKKDGLVFLTTDFAEDEQDHYFCAPVRAGKMFTKKVYEELLHLAKSVGFALLNEGEPEWDWREENRLVFDYGFASMALRREIEV